MSTTPPAGIEPANIRAWMQARVDVSGELSYHLIAGGHSNLTYRVTDEADRAWVLRRPPLHQVLATAHDMEREHRIIAALGASSVPVPAVVGLCTDEAVNGRPFYVMDFVDGLVVRSTAEAATLDPSVRRRVSAALVEVLASIHEVEPDDVGLGELGRREAYVERQLKRWLRQFEDSKTTERPLVGQIHTRLSERVPTQQRAAIVHGDYRLDNCIITPAGEVASVLDWELCTLGDPLVDIAQLLAYWAEPGDDTVALDDAPTQAGGFADRAEVLATYGAATGADLSEMAYYSSFADWRLACILEGVYSRYLSGAMGETPDNVHDFDTRIRGLLERSASHADQIGAS